MTLNILIDPGMMLGQLMLRVFNRMLDAGVFKKEKEGEAEHLTNCKSK
jgi:hypothetical protein